MLCTRINTNKRRIPGTQSQKTLLKKFSTGIYPKPESRRGLTRNMNGDVDWPENQFIELIKTIKEKNLFTYVLDSEQSK